MFLKIRSQLVQDFHQVAAGQVVPPVGKVEAVGGKSEECLGEPWKIQRGRPNTQPQCRVETQGMMVAPSSLMKASFLGMISYHHPLIRPYL